MEKLESSLKVILKTNGEASRYLINAALEQLFARSDKEPFLAALKQVIKAHSGISEVARLTNINRKYIYKMLSGKGNLSFVNISLLLAAVGIRLKAEGFRPLKDSFRVLDQVRNDKSVILNSIQDLLKSRDPGSGPE